MIRIFIGLAILLAVTVMGLHASLALASDDVWEDLVAIGEYRSTADCWRDTVSELRRQLRDAHVTTDALNGELAALVTGRG